MFEYPDWAWEEWDINEMREKKGEKRFWATAVHAVDPSESLKEKSILWMITGQAFYLKRFGLFF